MLAGNGPTVNQVELLLKSHNNIFTDYRTQKMHRVKRHIVDLKKKKEKKMKGFYVRLIVCKIQNSEPDGPSSLVSTIFSAALSSTQ